MRGECDDFEEAFNNQSELWCANVYRALRGRRGRAALMILREALCALPEPRLIGGALCTVGADKRADRMPSGNFGGAAEFRDLVTGDGEGVCAIGALLWYRRVQAGEDPADAFAALPTVFEADGEVYDNRVGGGAWEDGLTSTAHLAESDAGITFALAWAIAGQNDRSHLDETPEQRYTRILRWIDNQLAAPPLPSPKRRRVPA